MVLRNAGVNKSMSACAVAGRHARLHSSHDQDQWKTVINFSGLKASGTTIAPQPVGRACAIADTCKARFMRIAADDVALSASAAKLCTRMTQDLSGWPSSGRKSRPS